MIQAFVFLFYAVGLGYCIFKMPFFRLETISKRGLLGLFLFKLFAGVLYVFVSNHVIKAGDINLYYNDGLIIFAHLLEGDFFTFLQLTFGLNNVGISDNIAASVDAMGYWYDTSAYMIVRFNALINVFTLGTGIYANSLFFAFISFLGSILFAKLLEGQLRVKSLAIYVIFLTPSLWYWTSGLHKEAICVFLVAVVLFTFNKLKDNLKVKEFTILVIAITLLSLTRVFITAMLLPPLFAYFIAEKNLKFNQWVIFVGVFSLLGILTYSVPIIFDTPNMVDMVLEKKALYESLDNGNTAIELGLYKESYWGIIQKVPQALFHSLARPHFLDIKSVFLALASLESLVITILFAVSLFYIKNCNRHEQSFVFLLLSFALSYLIITGLIVPNIGAILRYRSLALFFLVPTLIYLIDKKDELES